MAGSQRKPYYPFYRGVLAKAPNARAATSRTNIAPRVKQIITAMAEKKYFDHTYTAFSPTPAWTWNSSIEGIAQGVDRLNRIGNKIRVTRVEYVVHVDGGDNSMAQDGAQVRMVCYHNKQPEGATPVSLHVWTLDVMDTLRDEIHKPQYVLTNDWVHTMVVTGTDSAGAHFTTGPKKFLHFSQPINKVVAFSDNGATIASLWKDDYGFGISSTAGSCCKMTIRTRTFFTDE